MSIGNFITQYVVYCVCDCIRASIEYAGETLILGIKLSGIDAIGIQDSASDLKILRQNNINATRALSLMCALAEVHISNHFYFWDQTTGNERNDIWEF